MVWRSTNIWRSNMGLCNVLMVINRQVDGWLLNVRVCTSVVRSKCTSIETYIPKYCRLAGNARM